MEYLQGSATATEIIQTADIPGLSVILAGRAGEDAEGLLLGPRLGELIKELKTRHEFVIFDGSPLLASDDSALLVPQADEIILVARPFFTKSRLMRQTLDMLYQRQAKQVSIVLNRARRDDWAGYRASNGLAVGAAKNGSPAHS